MTIAHLARRAAITVAITAALATQAAFAQSVEQFYKGKTITLIVGSGAAGGDDIFARVFAKYLPNYLPGHPNVVVQNQPGAGGLVAATQMFNIQPRDGTVIASVMRTVPMMPLLSDQPV